MVKQMHRKIKKKDKHTFDSLRYENEIKNVLKGDFYSIIRIFFPKIKDSFNLYFKEKNLIIENEKGQIKEELLSKASKILSINLEHKPYIKTPDDLVFYMLTFFKEKDEKTKKNFDLLFNDDSLFNDDLLFNDDSLFSDLNLNF